MCLSIIGINTIHIEEGFEHRYPEYMILTGPYARYRYNYSEKHEKENLQIFLG